MVDITLDEKPRGVFKDNCIIYIEEFAENTSLHGVRYLVEKRSKFEKIWWLVMIAFLLYFCFGMVREVYRKFDDAVVFISYDRKPTSVSEIPFPAITICPEVKSSQEIFNFTTNYLKALKSYNKSDESYHALDAISMICTSDIYDFYGRMNEIISNEAAKFILKAFYPFRKMFAECRWMLEYGECEKYFSPVLTEDGICYTYNMLPITQILRNNLINELENHPENFSTFENKSFLWSQESGYSENAPNNVFPTRVMVPVSNNFEIELIEDKLDIDYLCNGPEMGYKVVVHNPRDFPNVFSEHFKLSFNKKYMFNIKPSILTTSRSLNAYSPQYRQCYNNLEKNLTFFQYYSQKNCELECLTNFTLQLCGCASFYMPRYIDTKICGPGKVDCLEIARVKYSSLEVTTGAYSAESEEDVAESKNLMCECLPECNSLNYESEFIQQDYFVQPLIQRLNFNDTHLKNIQASSLSFKFKKMQFKKGERKLLYGFADLLANCGGLFSLFTGFSLISLVEFVYFCTLRLFCNFRRYGTYLWSGKKEA